MPPEFQAWLAQHPEVLWSGGAFLVALLVGASTYRQGFLVRALTGLATVASGIWFGWNVLKSIELASFTPVVGGLLGILFIIALLDDDGYYGGYGGGGRWSERFRRDDRFDRP